MQDEPASVVRTKCRPLLDVLRDEGLSRIDALKIDVEGAEDRILVPFLRDAPDGLRPHLIIIEDARDAWRDDLFSRLANCGYVIAARSRLNVMLRRK